MSEHEPTRLAGCDPHRALARIRHAALAVLVWLGACALPGCTGPGLEPPESDSAGQARDGGIVGSGDQGSDPDFPGAGGTGGVQPGGGASGNGGPPRAGMGGTGGGGTGGELGEPPLDGGVTDGGFDEDAGALR